MATDPDPVARLLPHTTRLLIRREWAMPNAATFTIPPIAALLARNDAALPRPRLSENAEVIETVARLMITQRRGRSAAFDYSLSGHQRAGARRQAKALLEAAEAEAARQEEAHV